MDDRKPAPDSPTFESDGGLYKNVHVSIRTLNVIIVGGCILLCLLMFMGTKNGGYTVTYNSKGGSDVPSQTLKFQETLSLANPPTRDGYRFTGWYLDESCNVPVSEPYIIEGSVELYAGWEQDSN